MTAARRENACFIRSVQFAPGLLCDPASMVQRDLFCLPSIGSSKHSGASCVWEEGAVHSLAAARGVLLMPTHTHARAHIQCWLWSVNISSFLPLWVCEQSLRALNTPVRLSLISITSSTRSDAAPIADIRSVRSASLVRSFCSLLIHFFLHFFGTFCFVFFSLSFSPPHRIRFPSIFLSLSLSSCAPNIPHRSTWIKNSSPPPLLL